MVMLLWVRWTEYTDFKDNWLERFMTLNIPFFNLYLSSIYTCSRLLSQCTEYFDLRCQLLDDLTCKYVQTPDSLILMAAFKLILHLSVEKKRVNFCRKGLLHLELRVTCQCARAWHVLFLALGSCRAAPSLWKGN